MTNWGPQPQPQKVLTWLPLKSAACGLSRILPAARPPRILPKYKHPAVTASTAEGSDHPRQAVHGHCPPGPQALQGACPLSMSPTSLLKPHPALGTFSQDEGPRCHQGKHTCPTHGLVATQEWREAQDTHLLLQGFGHTQERPQGPEMGIPATPSHPAVPRNRLPCSL